MLQSALLSDLFREKRQYVDYFFDHLNLQAVSEIYAALRDCRGTIFFTGVGKSGFIAQKIAATMLSTGTRALFVSPTDAIHGDLGIMQDGDVAILLSKSGESDELLSLVPCIRNKAATPIAIVSNIESRLAKACAMALELPLEKELCPFGLAPTTSATLQLIFGDVLTVALMRDRSFTLEEYARNHPAGSIGKRMTLKVQDLMLRGDALPCCKPSERLGDCFETFSSKRCGCLLVVDEREKLVGIFTDGDLRRTLQRRQEGLLDRQLCEVMTRAPKAIAHDAMAWDALRLMEADQQHPVMVLPVVDEACHLVGLIKLHDILQSGLG